MKIKIGLGKGRYQNMLRLVLAQNNIYEATFSFNHAKHFCSYKLRCYIYNNY